MVFCLDEDDGGGARDLQYPASNLMMLLRSRVSMLSHLILFCLITCSRVEYAWGMESSLSNLLCV